MKITIIYDNESHRKDLIPDLGFSCLVEIENTPGILFDAGANGVTLLHNMKKLGIEPPSIGIVFISHHHFDHVGGLSSFLNENSDVKVYVPRSLRGIRKPKAIRMEKPEEIYKNLFSTGEIDGIEHSMGVVTEKGIVLITGCSHPEMADIFERAEKYGKIRAVIGGFHRFNDFHLFKNLELICPTHCTLHKEKLKELYPTMYVDGGAGKVIQL